jgi:outer membrane protein OmpA-like peptidoglycan-associated protein
MLHHEMCFYKGQIAMNCSLTTTLFLAASMAATAQTSDFKDYKDPALFTRMPHYFLSSEDSFIEKAFDAFEFQLKEGTQTVEGRHLHYSYSFDDAAGNMPGTLQIVRNYQAAARKIGGQVLWDDVRRATIRISRNGQETWAFLEAFNEGRSYELHIVERGQMKQDVVADAAALGSGLKDAGHVEVTGIFFDFAKADIKPESEAALNEVIKLLRSNAAWKVWIVGHTDNVGTVESNLTLSAARAAAVVKALTQKGIAAGRLAAHGAGPFAPVAANDTEEGRARNRRVELVKQP